MRPGSLVLGLVCALAQSIFCGNSLAGDRPVQIAVLNFIPREPDPAQAWLSTGIAASLAGAFAEHEQVVVVERERVVDILRELDLIDKGVAAAPEAGRVARIAAADRAVLGGFAVRNGKLAIEASLVAADTGEVITVARSEGPISELDRLAGELAARLLGTRRPESAAPAAAVPVEALAEFYRGIAAEDRGDYPKAFLHLARAARGEPPHPEAGLRLGRLYHRMGEHEHAVATWRRVAREAVAVRAAEALILAGRVLERNVEDLAGAAEVYRQIDALWPERIHEVGHLLHGAWLQARTGNPEGALASLAKRTAALNAEVARVREKSKTDRQIRNHLWHSMQALVGATHQVKTAARRIAIPELLAGREPPSAPRDLVPVSPDKNTFGFEELCETQRDIPGGVNGKRTIHDLHLIAPGGLTITAVRLKLQHLKDPDPMTGKWTFQASLGPWGRSDTNVELDKERLELRLVAPAKVAHLTVAGIGWTVERYSIEVELSTEPAPPWPPAPRGSRRILNERVQQAEISRDGNGRVHVVFADGPQQGEIPHRGVGGIPPRFENSSLRITTSVDEAATFGPSRRLSVSSERDDFNPTLLHTRDGRHHLAWVSNRSDRNIYRIWYAVSDDLVRWSFPRQIPVPFTPMPMPMHEDSRMYAAGTPMLIEGRNRVVHCFFGAPWGSEGAGVYETRTADGLRWSTAGLVARKATAFAAHRRADGNILVAAWTWGEPLRFLTSPDGDRWSPTDLDIQIDPKLQPGRGRPALATGPDGSALLLHWIAQDQFAVSRLTSGRVEELYRDEADHGRVRGLLTLSGRRAATVFVPYHSESPGGLHLLIREIPE